jgi:hypothetical protein
MSHRYHFPTVGALNDMHLIVAGGRMSQSPEDILDTVEVYNVETNSFDVSEDIKLGITRNVVIHYI